MEGDDEFAKAPRADVKSNADSDESSSGIIVALVDNNSWEVGMAELDIAYPTKLYVSQITDDRSYTTALDRLRAISPKEILVPDSHVSRPLAEVLRKQYGRRVLALNRSLFNETRGGEVLNELAQCQVQTKQHLHSHYLARAAASALVSYADKIRGGDAIRRLVVELDPWMDLFKRLRMDASTMRALETVLNIRSGGKDGTLFSSLKFTRTPMGARLLRGQLISPPAERDTIESRYSAIDACIDLRLSGDDTLLSRIREILSRIGDLDHVASRFVSEPKRYTVRELMSQIEAVVAVRNFASNLTELNEALQPLESELWNTLKAGLADAIPLFSGFAQEISRVTSDPVSAKRADHHLQGIFCVRADVDGLLDVARLAYVQVVKEMEVLVDQLREEHCMPAIELKRSSARGYHLAVPRSYESRLPTSFVQAVRHTKAILCTTSELASLNNRQARLESEILTLTVNRLRPLHDAIAGSLTTVNKASEYIALIDMLLCFVEATETRGYSRPTLLAADDAEVTLREARHPILETIIPNCEPRDIVLSASQRLLIITGENCAGKTTILSQIALTVILAQIGCFVPAKSCSFPVFSCICTRLGTDDALEENASTFSLEMVDVASIFQTLNNAKPNRFTLVLIDELGRGTSSRDGLAIATAVAEEIATYPSARCFFATHFIKLRVLASIYPERIRSLCIAPVGQSHPVIDLDNDDYGIRLAEECFMPEEIIHRAREMRAQLLKHFAASRNPSESSNEAIEKVIFERDPESRLAYELCSVLMAIAQKTTSEEGTVDYDEAAQLLFQLRSQLQ